MGWFRRSLCWTVPECRSVSVSVRQQRRLCLYWPGAACGPQHGTTRATNAIQLQKLYGLDRGKTHRATCVTSLRGRHTQEGCRLQLGDGQRRSDKAGVAVICRTYPAPSDVLCACLPLCLLDNWCPTRPSSEARAQEGNIEHDFDVTAPA